MTLAERLHVVRELSGLNAKELSLLAGLAQNHAGMLERADMTDPRMMTVVKVAAVLGLSLDWLILGRGMPMAPPDRSDGIEAQPRARDVLGALADYREGQEKAARALKRQRRAA